MITYFFFPWPVNVTDCKNLVQMLNQPCIPEMEAILCAILNEQSQENALAIANTLFQEHKRWLYTWKSPDGQYRNQTDYILCSWRWRTSIQWAKTKPGADCGSNHELLIAKFRLKLKKVGKTTRPFRYDLNQILYDYTEEVRNRFKGIDLIECLKNYRRRFVTLYRRQWSRPSKKKKCKKAKWLSEEALQIAEKREAECQMIEGRDKKPS